EINEDSSFTVTEDATYSFTGELNGIRRDIPLYDAVKSDYCLENEDLTCGGFEIITLESVELDGEKLDEDEYEVYEVENEDGSRFFRIEKRLYDSATNVKDEEY